MEYHLSQWHNDGATNLNLGLGSRYNTPTRTGKKDLFWNGGVHYLNLLPFFSQLKN